MSWGNIAKGAGGGALAGGSVGGPWGAAIGAVGGGLLAAFQGDPEEKKRQQEESFYRELQRRQAPLIQNTHQADYSGFRQNQQNLISQLEAMGRGEGPSLAQKQLEAATDRNVKQQQGMALSGRGNATMAAQGAANNAGILGAQAGQDAAQARIVEQNNALSLLGLNLHGARDADEGMNRFNTGARNNTEMLNQQARSGMYGLTDAGRLGLLNGQQPGPGMGDQLLAGGAGMFAQGAAQRSNNNGSRPYLAYPGGY